MKLRSNLLLIPFAAAVCLAQPPAADPLPSLADAVARIVPAVVVIQSYAAPESPPAGVPQPPPAPWRRLNTGAGLLLPMGERTGVLTCHHLVDGADRLLLTLHDGRAAETELLASDPVSDLAVVNCPWDDLPAAPIGAQEPRAGDWVFTVGHPFEQYPYTAAVGILSFVGRSFEVGERSYTGLLQTDAAMNRGSSGGPLCDLAGRVIGLQVAIYSPTGSNAGIGFAMPIATALLQAERLATDGGLPYLGLTPKDLTPALAAELRLSTVGGVVVRQRVPGGPGDAAGVLAGDRVTAFDGQPTPDLAAFEQALWQHRIGDPVTLDLDRRGTALQVEIVCGWRPAQVVGGR